MVYSFLLFLVKVFYFYWNNQTKGLKLFVLQCFVLTALCFYSWWCTFNKYNAIPCCVARHVRNQIIALYSASVSNDKHQIKSTMKLFTELALYALDVYSTQQPVTNWNTSKIGTSDWVGNRYSDYASTGTNQKIFPEYPPY